MDKVGRIAHFPKTCFIAQFLGKGYDDAVRQAEEWQKNTGNICHSYYEQVLVTKYHSILVAYTKKEIEHV